MPSIWSIKKQYKRYLKHTKYTYERQLWNKLDQVRQSNPRSFWNLFKKIKDLDTQHKSNPIPANEWVSHFSKLLNTPLEVDPCLDDYITDYIKCNKDKIFNELDFQITESEIYSAIHRLKTKKASGPDGIIGELVKASSSFMIKQLHTLFNQIFTYNHYPSSWRVHSLTPLHKKGDTSKPANYHGIAVGCCLSKVFLGVLHNRLLEFVDKHKLIPNCQIGYKHGSRTSDHILTLKNLIDKYLLKGKYMFACFVDYKSAFDTVWRKGLFFKLLRHGIGCNFLSTLQSVYSEVHYNVKLDFGMSPTISSANGVKQGCVLSPTLFNLFLSDFPSIFDNTCDPVSLGDAHLNCMMFADDLVLLSTTAEGLQCCLDKLLTYTRRWNLNVNIDKTKVIIFNKGGHIIKRFNFWLGTEPVSITQQYCYLGIIFTPSGSFNSAITNLTDKAMKAFFRLKQLNPRDNAILTIKLFESLVVPILTYACEVWGPLALRKVDKQDFKSLCDSVHCEKLNIRLCKYLLGVGKRATNAAVIAELGRFPISFKIIEHSVNYWHRLRCLPELCLVKQSHIDSLPHESDNHLKRFWSGCVQQILRKFDSNLDWENQSSDISVYDLTTSIKAEYQTLWYNFISRPENNKLLTYSMFKHSISLEIILFKTA